MRLLHQIRRKENSKGFLRCRCREKDLSLWSGWGNPQRSGRTRQSPPTHPLSLSQTRSGVFLPGFSLQGYYEFLQVLLDGESLEGRERLCLKYARRSRSAPNSPVGLVLDTQRHYSERLRERTVPSRPGPWLADGLPLLASAGSATSFELRSRPSRPSRQLSKAVALHTDRWPPMPTGTQRSGLPPGRQRLFRATLPPAGPPCPIFRGFSSCLLLCARLCTYAPSRKLLKD